MSQKTSLGPLTGIAFVVLVIIGLVIAGEPPGADEPAQDVVRHYVDNKDSVMIGALLTIPGVVLLLFFAGTLRHALQQSGGPGTMFPGLVLAGATIIAVAAGIDATISMALAERADDIDPTAVQALQALWDHDYVPFAIGLAVFFLSAGIAMVQSRGYEREPALPRWMGYVAIVLGVAAMTPVGFVAFMGGALWIVVAGILMMRTDRAVPATPPPGA